MRYGGWLVKNLTKEQWAHRAASHVGTADDLYHIFDRGDHPLGWLLELYGGSQQETYGGVSRHVQYLFDTGTFAPKADGAFGIGISIDGHDLWVSGYVFPDGTVDVSNFYTPPVGDSRMSQTMFSVEREAAEKLLVGKHPALFILRSQLPGCKVVSRDFDHIGYIAELELDPNAPIAELPGQFHLAGVRAVPVTGTRAGISFSMRIKEGRLSRLEVETFGDPWPEGWPESSRGSKFEYLQTPLLLDSFTKRSK